MSSYVDATPRAGTEAVEEGDRPPPPSHRSRRIAALGGTPTEVLPDPTGPMPAGDGAAWHRTALLAASLAPDDEPPFLTEPTVAVPTRPPALGPRLSELAYRRRAIAATAVATLVLAAAVLVSRVGSGGDGSEDPGSPLADGGAALMEPVRAALAAFGSTERIAPSVAPGSAGSAGFDGSTTTTPEPTTTTAEPTTTVPSTASVPAEVPGTVQPRFCTVWVDGPLTVLTEPYDGAAVAGQLNIGLYWVSAVTEDRPRWYLIDNGDTRGWARGDDVDRQGDCRGRR